MQRIVSKRDLDDLHVQEAVLSLRLGICSHQRGIVLFSTEKPFTHWHVKCQPIAEG